MRTLKRLSATAYRSTCRSSMFSRSWMTCRSVLRCRKAARSGGARATPFWRHATTLMRRSSSSTQTISSGEAFKKIGAFLRNVKEDGERAHSAMVGYHLKNTLTENGHVARGVCVEKDGVLDTIVERTYIEKREDVPAYTEDDG